MQRLPRASMVVACAFGIAAAVVARADWSSDPAVNLAVGDRTGEQGQSKIRATSDGGAYVSWYDNNAGGYDTYLQRLDDDGAEQWGHNGILIADTAFSSTQDYDLDVDADHNALVTIRDDRFGGVKITVQKVAPNGTFPWGANGVQVSPGASDNQPKAAVLSDGSVVVGWPSGSPSFITLQKLDGNGAPQWTAPGITLVDPPNPTSRPYNLSDIQPSEDGGFIVLWIRCTGSNCVTSNKHLYAQKFDAAGNPQWNAGAPVIVFDANSVQNGYFPTFIADGAGGAVFGWYETGGSRRCIVQRVSGAGAELYGHNGVAAAIQVGRIGLSPSIAYNPDSDEIFEFWTEANTLQNAWGLYGQKFTGGVRQWGDNGKELQSLTANQNAFVRTALRLDGAMVFAFDRSGAAKVIGTAVDGNGDFVWSPAFIDVRSTLADKSRLDVAMSPCGSALLTWGEGTVADRNILGQNVTVLGTRGIGVPSAVQGDANGDLAVTLADYAAFAKCMNGPHDPSGPPALCPGACATFDFDGDEDVDLADHAAFAALFQ